MKIQYQQIALRTKSVAIIEQANVIIEEYAVQGYSLTLRQLYYQFVARGLLDNKQRNYKMLGEVISSGRRAGLIDWEAIVDRTRFLRTKPHWSSPADIIDACAKQFRYNPWDEQKVYIEVWFEKDALLGVFERASEEFRLPFFSCRGYVSDSECWSAAQRIAAKERDKKAIVLHFGDHDPSGIDMTRDIGDRFNLFGAFPTIKRMALNMDQVKQYNPPPNPAKQTDSRFDGYLAEYGDESWELDALNPDVLNTLVIEAVKAELNMRKWNEVLKAEKKAREELRLIAAYYNESVLAAKQADE